MYSFRSRALSLSISMPQEVSSPIGIVDLVSKRKGISGLSCFYIAFCSWNEGPSQAQLHVNLLDFRYDTQLSWIMGIWDRSQLLANYIKSCEEGLSAGLQVSWETSLIVPDYFVSDYNMGFVSSYICSSNCKHCIMCALVFFKLLKFIWCTANQRW